MPVEFASNNEDKPNPVINFLTNSQSQAIPFTAFSKTTSLSTQFAASSQSAIVLAKGTKTRLPNGELGVVSISLHSLPLHYEYETLFLVMPLY